MIVTSVEDYFRQTIRTEPPELTYGTRRRTIQTNSPDVYRRFYHDYYNMTMKLKQIGWYTLAISVFPYPKLAPFAQQAIELLPSTFNPDNSRVWEEYFENYGTHLIVASHMGGQMWTEVWFDKCLNHEHSAYWLDEQIQATFSHGKTIDENFKRHSMINFEIIGGNKSTPFPEWLETIKYNPRPISYRLVSIDKILPPSPRRWALQAAISAFLKKAESADREYIDNLESTRGPPPKKCSRNRIRRNGTPDRLTSTATTATNYANIRKALCPYVGYEGATCAGVLGRQMIEPDYLQVSLYHFGSSLCISTTSSHLFSVIFLLFRCSFLLELV